MGRRINADHERPPVDVFPPFFLFTFSCVFYIEKKSEDEEERWIETPPQSPFDGYWIAILKSAPFLNNRFRMNGTNSTIGHWIGGIHRDTTNS